MSEPTTDLAIPTFDEETLREITSFEDALALVRETYGDIVHAADELGTGFAIVEDKDTLIGRPLLVLQWTTHAGDFGDFVSALVVNGDGRFILNDGSTGICQQLQNYEKRTGRNGGLMVRNGLRRSDYKYTDEKGQQKPATTYYLDTSA